MRALVAIVVFACFSPPVASAAPEATGQSPARDPGPDRAALERETRVLKLGIAGGMLFSQTYSTTALVATGALLICWYDREGKYCGLESAQSAWYELYIPAAGPFVALRHEEVRSNWRYTTVFSASGVLQTVGITLAAVSLLWPTSDVARLSLPVAVTATRDTQQLSFHGSF